MPHLRRSSRRSLSLILNAFRKGTAFPHISGHSPKNFLSDLFFKKTLAKPETKKIMNKRQTVWLITRLIGVYFAYLAIFTALSLIGAIYGYFSSSAASTTSGTNTSANARTPIPTPTIRNPGIELPKSEAEKTTEKLKSDAGKEVLSLFFLTAIYGGVAFYLTRNGKILSTVLNREELTDETDETASVSPAKPKEKIVTTLDLSYGKKEEVTSLNLSEYVPKKAETAPPIVEKVEETIQPEVSPDADEQTWKDLEIAQVETVAEQSAPISPVEQLAPEINEQPNEQPAPSDVSADVHSDEKQ